MGEVTSTERLALKKLTSCHDGIGATAEVTIAAASSDSEGGRMLSNEEEAHSVGLFYQLRDTVLEIEAGTRKLSFEGEHHVNASSAWSFAVSQMEILPCASDLEALKTDPDLVEEEQELLHLASLGETRNDKHNDMILREVRIGLKHEREKMESLMAAEREHEDAKMDVMMKHEDAKMNAMMKHEDEKREADRKHGDEMMNAMLKHEDVKMQIMLEEMQTLRIQLTVVTVVCVVVSVAAFLKLKQ